MARIQPLAREELAEFEPFFKLVEGSMGFVPRSLFTMGRRPDLLRAFAGLSGTILAGGRGGTLDRSLVQLIAYVASRAAGCSYCQAHASHGAHRAGASEERIAAAFEYETSDLFDDAERAALRLANDAALVPNAASDAHFEALREHFDEEQIVEIVSVISLFGYLNRWNDTVATTLEDGPRVFGEKALAAAGWSAGKHA